MPTGKKIIMVLAFAFGFNAVIFAQDQVGSQQVNPENQNCIEQHVSDDEIKLYATEFDLETLQIAKQDNSTENLPAILMPTSHAKEYAVVDFSACSDGIYFINGTKGQSKICYIIILQKQK